MSFAFPLLTKLWISNLGLIRRKTSPFPCVLRSLNHSAFEICVLRLSDNFKSKHILENVFRWRAAMINPLVRTRRIHIVGTMPTQVCAMRIVHFFVLAGTVCKSSDTLKAEFILFLLHGVQTQTSWISWNLLRGENISPQLKTGMWHEENFCYNTSPLHLHGCVPTLTHTRVLRLRLVFHCSSFLEKGYYA